MNNVLASLNGLSAQQASSAQQAAAAVVEHGMNYLFATINAFIEDTCVIMVIAYLLTRVSSREKLAGARLTVTNRWKFGLALGLVGLTEIVFPIARFPYVTNTLIGTYAAFFGGIEVGAIALGVMTLGSLLWLPMAGIPGATLAVALSVLVGLAIRSVAHGRAQVIAAIVASMLVQALITLAYACLPALAHTAFPCSTRSSTSRPMALASSLTAADCAAAG
jgi:hypothetical protein